MKLDETSYDLLVEEDADVFTPEGDVLFRFRKRILSPAAAAAAFTVLREVKTKTNNRGTAAGKIYKEKILHTRKDGSPTNSPKLQDGGDVMSSIIGYFDRYPRFPFCRQTAFNANEPEKFARVLPFLQSVDGAYRSMDPERYARQAAVAARTSRDFLIAGTTFTTITVNQNFQTAVHTDQGDLKAGLSCILVLRAGDYKGGNLVFPHYRAAVRLDTTDLLLFDSHHMHGNTPIFGRVGEYQRVSLVCYYRERMIDCGTAAEELERAKNRKRGDKLHGK